MAQLTTAWLINQVQTLWRRFALLPGLPFPDVLRSEQVEAALQAEQVASCNCLYSPVTTIRMLLAQAMDPDPSLRQAVSRLLAEHAAAGRVNISASTGGYSEARRRLPEGVLQRLTTSVGHDLRRQAPSAWRWKGRDVKIVDGTTVSMPDTPENQQEYPQPTHERPSLGFPLARLVVVFSLAVGTVLEAALGRCAGKQTGETALFRRLHEQLDRDDVILSDRYFCSYFELALLQQRSIDAVMRLHQRRPIDFRRGRRLGPDDHVIVWTKPKCPDWMDEATYQQLPDHLEVREVRLRVPQRGFRTQVIVVVTTFTDPTVVSRGDLTDLYRMRWHAELDLRSLKQVMQMSILRGKTPEMARKEIWAHFLAYNLIRTLLAQAAQRHGVLPRELSFKGALQLVMAFGPLLLRACEDELPDLVERLLDAIAQHRVGNRPDRYEPRARKRRYDNFMHLQRPRAQAKARLAKGICD